MIIYSIFLKWVIKKRKIEVEVDQDQTIISLKNLTKETDLIPENTIKKIEKKVNLNQSLKIKENRKNRKDLDQSHINRNI